MKYEVVLLPSFTHVDWWRKRHADSESSGLFAQVVTTFDAWIADLWELHGDGRLVVDDAQRDMLAYAAARETGGSDFARAFAPVIADCLREAAGLPELEEAVSLQRQGADASALSQRERELVRAMARYEALLDECGLVEFGSAVNRLALQGKTMFPQGIRVYMPMAAPLTWIQQRFFSECRAVDLTREPAEGEEGVKRAPAGVEVRFGCPSGALAEPGLIADAIEELGGQSSAVIACSDPIDLFKRLERRLGLSYRMCVQASKPFIQTDFGRAFTACFHCVHDDSWDPAYLSDALSSAFSGASREQAIWVDKQMRADRLMRREEALQEARSKFEVFSQLEELVSDPDADVLIGAFEHRVLADAHRSAAWRAEQLAALGVVRSVMSAARMAGVGMEACMSALERASVPIAFSNDSDGAQLLVTSQPMAAQLAPESFDAAIIADLTAENYPVADRDDAVATFFSKFQLTPTDSEIQRARRDFSALLSVPTSVAMLVRPLGDVNADETYPAAVLEEFVDAYRFDPSDSEEVDNPYRLPKQLQQGLVGRGEELLFANAQAGDTGCCQAAAEEIAWPGLAYVSAAESHLVMPARRDAQGKELPKACPSPSQVEAYLACPFKWFAERRMGVETLDEDFGARERGSFAHTALERFYRRFQAAGHAKVNEANLDEARLLMRAVTEELMQQQVGEKPGNRYVATTELERRDVESLCRQLEDYLDFEAQLLPTFHPAFFEYEIDADHAVDYAGYSLVGMVDRIDVDDAGHAVIIDYKGSVGADHEIAGKDRAHAGKVQTRIYARAVERALGLDVVGAIYVSYGTHKGAAGAYDPRVLEAAHLPDMKHDRCSCGLLEGPPDLVPEEFSFADLTFERMLDETEAMVGEAIASMVAGEVAPKGSQASKDNVCRYCAVLSCPAKRGA